MLKKLDVHAVLAGLTALIGLAVTNGLITNEDGKIVTGFASASVALGFLIYGAVKHQGATKVEVAKIAKANGSNVVAPPPSA